MKETTLTIPEQIKIALDGRTNRWLSKEIKVVESDLSKKMNGRVPFKQEEIDAINARLGVQIKL